MKTSNKLVVTLAASLLGLALAASGAHAATGALTTKDAPGQVLQVSGVGPASEHASTTASAHAIAKAKGLFGAKPAHANAKVTRASGATAMHSSVRQVLRQAPQTLPAYHAVVPHMTASVQPAVPQPMMSPGASMPSHPMH